MITSSRKTLRKAYAALLNTALVGTGKLAQAVYDYQVGDFKGASPVVCVTSAGALRQRLTFQGSTPAFWLNIHVFVLYATEDASWTEAMAEDAIDDIEAVIAAVNDANQINASWQGITQEDRSQADSLVIGGLEYRRETFLLRFE